ncbi:MAG TPA: efflux RND transporter periplasmic adaptor subunit [Chitinophagaceae bacterium]|nr:efflux RND transporter periplasmic adaptor subunit [Chitinophagaceae bacterium]
MKKLVQTRTLLLLLAPLWLAAGCKTTSHPFDASGAFEANETIISAEANGVIEQFRAAEGTALKAGEVIGYIDSTQLYLRKKQLEAQLRATSKRLPNLSIQTGFYKQQAAVTQSRLNNLLHEQARLQRLLQADAATPKQLDDINAQIDETRKQLAVTETQKDSQLSSLQTQSSGISADLLPLQVQIEQVNDQLAKCRIVNPLNGTVLTTYAEEKEMATQGKPLYKIANLSNIILRAYITGNQLPMVKLQQPVTVLTDDGKGGYRQTTGSITWISDKAEFTPKTIQTKDERANMVYAIKVNVKNDGTYKIGMYGEIKF